MSTPEILFWILVSVLVYTYVGYGTLIALFIRMGWGRKEVYMDRNAAYDPPRVFFIITAFNEEAVIASKIENTLALGHPADKLVICVNADGSTDSTARIAASHPGVLVLHQPERFGKAAAMNRSVELAGDAGILVFSDANTMLGPDALRVLIGHFSDPRVGAVSGEKKVLSGDEGMVQAVGESLYWRYESVMKGLDSKFNTVVGAAGELLAVRSSLYRPIPADTILDDLHLSIGICRQGHVVGYEPSAVARESASGSIAEEWERKVRIGAGAFQTLSRCPSLLLPWPDLKLWFQFISRRFLRWVACPVALPLLLFLNIRLASGGSGPVTLYQWLLAAHLLFYGLAILGWWLPASGSRWRRLFHLPFYFLFMHYSLWAGFFRWLSGAQPVAWEKASRSRTSI